MKIVEALDKIGADMPHRYLQQKKVENKSSCGGFKKLLDEEIRKLEVKK